MTGEERPSRAKSDKACGVMICTCGPIRLLVCPRVSLIHSVATITQDSNRRQSLVNQPQGQRCSKTKNKNDSNNTKMVLVLRQIIYLE